MTVPILEQTSSGQPPSMSHTYRALKDLGTGLLQWRLWMALAGRDIRRGYRGSFFGHVWIALSLGIFVLIIGNIYALVFHMDTHAYVPFLCSGLISWRLITQFLLEGGSVFLGSGGFIKGLPIPLSVFLYKSVLKNLIVFAHYLAVYVVVMAVFSVPFTASTLLLIPGILLVALNGLWVLAFMGILCTRFRDVQQLISSLMILLFFVTPVLWPESRVESLKQIVNYNPLYHVLQILREPLLGRAPDLLSWLVVLSIGGIGLLITFLMFARFRTRIVFWI